MAKAPLVGIGALTICAGVVACTEPPPATLFDAGAVDYTISSAALSGCRAPDEPGCSTCCTGTTGLCGVCDSNGPETVPAYDGGAYLECTFDLPPGPYRCTSDCPLCAQCTKKAESVLRKGLACDCAHVVVAKGDLVCSDPGSCACYCFYLGSAEALCPAGG